MTNQEIKDTGLLIRNEQQIGGNTALRVGGVIEGIGYALDNKDAANGYYQATINGGSISVNAPNYLLGTGGNLRIKMPAAGTTASTLTIGNANAVQLWYNGATVSAQNTWEQGEIISVFYDGTRFMASNSQGGGGKAEKIKYDNSQSGLAAENVQGAVDEVSAFNIESENITFDSTETGKYIKDNTGVITNATSSYTLAKVNLPAGKYIFSGIKNSHPVMWKYNSYTYNYPTQQIIGALDNEAYIITVEGGYYAICWNSESVNPSVKTYSISSGMDNKHSIDEIAGLYGSEIVGQWVRALYINENDNGKITSNVSQRGYAFPVSQGDIVTLVCNESVPIRYGFTTSIPTAGNYAQNYVNSITQKVELTSPVDGYLFVTRSDVYPNVHVYGQKSAIVEAVDGLLNSVEDIADDEISYSKAVQGVYIDTGTGVITSNHYQRGLSYPVVAGQKIKIFNPNGINTRYGFVTTETPIAGNSAYNYVFTADKVVILMSPIDGYFYASNSNTYPNIKVYNAVGVSDSVELLQEDKEDRHYNFKYKLSAVDTSVLTSLTNATISNGVVNISQGGQARSATNMWEDEVKIAFKVTPIGSTFNVLFGRYATTAGTLFGLRKDASKSYLDTYNVTTLVDSFELPFNLISGGVYFIVITKYTFNYTYIKIEITSNDGQYYSYLNTGTDVLGSSDEGAGATIGRLWGVFHFSATTGSCAIENLVVYTPYKKTCQALFLGHSYIEGNSIEGSKLTKFSKIAQLELGADECGIFGHGGDTCASGLAVLQGYIVPNYSPKYLFVCEGANDQSITLANYQTWASDIASACTSINAIPVFFTIPPIDGSYKGNWASINTWLRASSYKVVDMDKCFVDANGNTIASNYLNDNVHPTLKTHKAIYNRILEDVPELLDVD